MIGSLRPLVKTNALFIAGSETKSKIKLKHTSGGVSFGSFLPESVKIFIVNNNETCAEATVTYL